MAAPPGGVRAAEARSARAEAAPGAAVQDLQAAAVMARPVAEAAPVASRREQAQRLLRDHPGQIEPDPLGQPIVRGMVLAIAPTAEALAKARRAGFGVGAPTKHATLGIDVVVLTAPRGVSAVEAARRLQALDPEGRYEFEHVYQLGGGVGMAQSAPAAGAAARAAATPGVRVGLLDGSVARGQPTLAGARLVQRAFAPGGAKATAHATAVASLIAGAWGPFEGAAPGATLYVADVYGPSPVGGSVSALVRGLAWMAENRVPVINISLVGPPNRLLSAAIQALVARGHIVVAAVGNDGPAAEPLYPAAYPGVVAVTGVDARQRVLPEAVRGPHVDFAAPGADMAAGGMGTGFVKVRGTSFAAPIAAGRLARLLPRPDPAAAARAIDALTRQSADLGPKGRDPVYGQGLVAFDVRTDPASVGAQRTALRGR
ncbi:S8 family serine peptidase [Phenylobacterium sp.]|uniref:S8 family serine peptidase n=1 Tax=Phenylobacterium sp. TaxID=1871053 RepID=UPI0035B03631